MWLSEMNETSIVTMPAPSPRPGRSPGPSARALTPSMTVTRASLRNLPVQLAVADVEGDHVPRAALQQHVGEAAGRGADIDAEPAGHVDREHVERVRQLDAAAADPRVFRLRDMNLDVVGHQRCRLWPPVALPRSPCRRESTRARARAIRQARASPAACPDGCVQDSRSVARRSSGQSPQDATRPDPHRRAPAPPCHTLSGQRARLVEAKEAGIRGLSGSGILARGLAERVGRCLDVENVVDDLKRQADVRAHSGRWPRCSLRRRQPSPRRRPLTRESGRRFFARACRRS